VQFPWILGFPNPLDPLVALLKTFIIGLYALTHNYGWSVILLAVAVKLVLWPAASMQFKSMAKMQRIAPKIKALQGQFTGKDPETVQKLNAATMALYRESGVNPAAGCIPAIIQMPILISLYWAIISFNAGPSGATSMPGHEAPGPFAHAVWGWIGSGFSRNSPLFYGKHLLAPNLSEPDYLLVGIYMISMYFSVKFSSPPSADPAQAQQQKLMAFLSPAMIGYFSIRSNWPSALLLYWVTFNLVTMAQQAFLMNHFKREGAELPTTVVAAPSLAPDRETSRPVARKRGSRR